MTNSTRLAVKELNQVGEARRAAVRLCEILMLDPNTSGRAALVVTELARNLVIHAGGGEIVLHGFTRGKQRGIEILALDRGLGMRNVGECLRDGYSTAGTPGTGLGAVRRMSDFFDLSTQEGKGTAVCSRIYFSREIPSMNGFEVGAVNIPLAGQAVCGDGWKTVERNGNLRGMVVDGLGHGERAHEAAIEAVTAFDKHTERPLEEILKHIHESLLKTRGAAGIVFEIKPSASEFTVAGVGNVVARVISPNGQGKQLASVNGTLGANATRFRAFHAPWTPDSTVVVHTDGLTANWDLNGYPGILQRHPSTLAGILYRDFARGRDDATVVVIVAAR